MCSPTRAGFLTGRHSFRTGVTNAIGAPGSTALDAGEITLPQLIPGPVMSRDYSANGIWAAEIQHLMTGGFDHHSGVLAGDLAAYDSWYKYENGLPVDADPTTPLVIDPVTQYATEANVQDAFNWIDAQTSNWLAVVAFNAPHTDNNGDLHDPTATCDGVDAIGTDINGMIECVDYHIDWLLSELATIGELENTTVIFIGDNGTDAFSLGEPFVNSSNPSQKMEVYEGGIRVPFIISDGYHLQHGTTAPSSTGKGYISSPGRRDTHHFGAYNGYLCHGRRHCRSGISRRGFSVAAAVHVQSSADAQFSTSVHLYRPLHQLDVSGGDSGQSVQAGLPFIVQQRHTP